MRDVTLWRAVFGVEKTVIEWIEFDQDAELLVAHVGRRSGSGAGVGCVDVGALDMTPARVDARGGPWTWGRSVRCWRLTRRG